MEEVTCDFKYSGAGAAFIGCAAATTLALVAAIPFPLPARLAAFAWVIALALHALHALRRPTALRMDSERAIGVRGAGGEWRGGSLRDGSFAAPWLTLVRWRPEGARFDRVLVILPDMLPPEPMRKIRVILKWA